MQRVVCVGVLSLVLGASCSAVQKGSSSAIVRAAKVPAPKASRETRPNPRTSSIATAAWNLLRDGLEDKKAANRIAVLSALSDLGPMPHGVRLASASLNDKDADVRKQAALTLGAMKARAAIPRLRAALEDKDAEVTLAAAQALWSLGDRAGRNVLLQVVAGERPTTDGLLDTEMREMHHRLQNPKGLVVMGAEKGAGALLGPFSFGIPVAKQMLADPANSERALTVSLLAHNPDSETLDRLKKALWDKDWSVREASARAVGSLRRRGFVPLLAPLLEDQKSPVQYSAAVAILRLTPVRHMSLQPQPVQRASAR